MPQHIGSIYLFKIGHFLREKMVTFCL